MEILNNGIWVGSDAGKHHQFDEQLSHAIANLFKFNDINNVIDIGCGLGYYKQVIESYGITCDGFDGNPNTPELTNNKCQVLDVSENIENQQQYDGLLCLEVGEHIPKEKEQVFIKNLAYYSPTLLVLSWALPNQGGDGHVNEQTNQYIINKFMEYGYTFQTELTEALRYYVTNCWWFKQSIMVFYK